ANGALGCDGGFGLTASSGIGRPGGTITGAGTIASTVSASGVAAIAASGGTLEVTGAIGDSGSLALIVTGAGDKLLLDASSAAASLTFNGSTGTLELAGWGPLTLPSALSIGGGRVRLDGIGWALTDNAGISIGSGTITGIGRVTGAITTTGPAAITASGGALEIASTITDSGHQLTLSTTGSGTMLMLDAA